MNGSALKMKSAHSTAYPMTGLGIVSAAGHGVDETRRTFFTKNAPVWTKPDESRFLKLKADESWPRRFDLPEEYFEPNLLCLLAIEEALNSAGLSKADLKNKRVGVCLGSTAGASNYHDPFAEAYTHGKLPDPEPLLSFFKTNTAQFTSRYYDLRGPVMMLNNACTSGADSIGVAAGWLDADICDLVICGGTESIIERIYFGFRSLMLCSPGLCKPFDKNRQGLTLGEGAGIVILEKNSTPRKPLVKYLGYGSGTDAFHPTSPHPEGRGLDHAIKTALANSGRLPTEIDFVNAHATATPHNDLTEGRWILSHMPQARVVATKGYTGHTLGAAGAIEAVLTAISLIDQKLPASRGFAEPDPAIGLSPTLDTESGNFSTALSVSLGFGGTNAALCMGRV